MMRALGLDARMSSEKLAATARRYANLMAASREGHVMAASDAAAGEGFRGWTPRVFGNGRPRVGGQTQKTRGGSPRRKRRDGRIVRDGRRA